MMSSILEELSGLPTGRRIEPLPTEGRIVATNDMDRFTYEHILSDSSPSATTTSSTAATCRDIDIEGVAEERVVEGDELYIQRNSYHNIRTCHDVMDVF